MKNTESGIDYEVIYTLFISSKRMRYSYRQHFINSTYASMGWHTMLCAHRKWIGERNFLQMNTILLHALLCSIGCQQFDVCKNEKIKVLADQMRAPDFIHDNTWVYDAKNIEITYTFFNAHGSCKTETLNVKRNVTK